MKVTKTANTYTQSKKTSKQISRQNRMYNLLLFLARIHYILNTIFLAYSYTCLIYGGDLQLFPYGPLYSRNYTLWHFPPLHCSIRHHLRSPAPRGTQQARTISIRLSVCAVPTAAFNTSASSISLVAESHYFHSRKSSSMNLNPTPYFYPEIKLLST